ncbi:efflux RND transporter periplasmic adaptor subunit [Labilibacter sediminis]|nr:efflux RND transporter periplasmic adaptor subunit [Labilibacter sediminis]
MKFSKTIILLITGGLLFHSCSNNSNTESQTKSIAVETKKVAEIPVSKTYQFSGNINSVKKSTLSTRIMGQVDKIYAHEGDKIEKGQLLIAIRSNDIAAKKSQVEANIIEVSAAYKNAETDYNRIKNLYKNKSATKKELDDISTHYKMMEAKLHAVEKAKAEVEEMMTYANIRAPYSGTITDLFVDAGDMANPGMPLIAVEAPGVFEVITRIPESEINLLEKGDTVQVALKSTLSNIKGIISRISPSSRFSGSQFETRILLLPENDQLKNIRSGMFAQINLFKGIENKILVSQDLIVHRGQLTGVWTIGQTGNALLRWVRLGKLHNNKVEVISGLSKGDQLIVKSDKRLHDGLKVNSL